MMRRTASVLLTLLLAACGGKETVSEYSASRPADLVDFQPTLSVKIRWSAQLNRETRRRGFNLAPVERDGRVYIAESQGRLAAYDATTGKLVWERIAESTLSSGLAVGGGVVFVGTEDGEVFALDSVTGSEKWRTALSSEVLAAPQLAAGKVIVGLNDGRVIALDAATGHRIWISANTVPALSLRGNGHPIVIGERVIAGFANGHLAAFNLHNGKRLWETTVAVSRGRSEIERLVDIDATPIVVDGVIYSVTYQGQVAAVTLENGQILWARDASSATDIAVDEQHVYFSDSNGELWALDRKSGATYWRQDKLHGRSITAPAQWGDYIVVGDFEGYVHWMSRTDGHFVARARMIDADRKAVVAGKVYLPEDDTGSEAKRPIRIAPLAGTQSLYLRDENGVLVAYQFGS